MRIYHGSLDIVDCPKILQPNRSLDYGNGFYATTSFKQAEEWAKRRMGEKQVSKGYVNEYELNEEILNSLNCLSFIEPSHEWVEFVMSNRINKVFTHNYDVVYGPVANDKVYLQFNLYEAGVISEDTLIRELKTYKLVDQYLFHTQKALSSIRFVQAIII